MGQSGAHRDGVAVVRRRRGFKAVAFSGEGGGAPVAGGACRGALQHETDEGVRRGR
jgi:hypothetical protein